MSAAMTPAYLRPKDAARYMSVGQSTLYRLMGRKQLRVREVGGVRLIAVKDIDALIEGSPVAEINTIK